MISNNRVASFYPSTKKMSFTSVNPTQKITNQGIFYKGQAINEQYTNDSVELALITVNLSSARFRTMTSNSLEVYIKTMAYNNSFDSKKYLLALNILLNELGRIQQGNVSKNFIQMEHTKPTSILEQNIMTDKIDFNNISYVEPDEFKLNFPSNKTTTNHTEQTIYNISNNTNVNNNQNQQLFFKNNKNLEMSSYSGNPSGIVKIINSKPGNSLRPFNQVSRDNTTQHSFSNSNSTHNNVINQSSFRQNTSSVIGNGGKQRSSNLDVSTSKNYLIIDK
jgi:hypothetical protein